ncbi:dipeptidyl-peptidase 7 [Kordia sp. SMS9]|uniref:S46 family peptidase n=1 Tax=Kordia sp. SMS9 TaxID=2282170 RepID=UPI000E0DA8ED|nr:S46 family peptidase [Kordia sp. SMS9]AXG69132.1 dipeptidyl-peptidase 7 [Kordia sp. SMS9]
MKKIILFIIVSIFMMPTSSKANEGMWFLMFIDRLNHRDMQKMGLQLTAEEIYSINNNSLKDAIVQFNGGCTASIISEQGLVLTNHHCGYDAIAELSTEEKNHLKNGFWAKSFDEELKPESLYVRFFVRMDDVSERILSKVNDTMSEKEREAAINKEIAVIEKENNEGGKYTVSVRSFFQGNEFYFFVYEDYEDVRLVGTPTESIGKFGGDTDNWEWPRHTGDFSLFRVYTDKDGNAAKYSEDNIPMKPKKHLAVDLTGVKENDFAMILGYPGRTNRWMPAEGIEQNVQYAYPAWVEASKVSMDVMKKHMDNSEDVNLKYASAYAGIANYWKNRQGMIDALTKHGTADKKRALEKKFDRWANKKRNKEMYGNVVSDINAYYALTNDKARHDNYLIGLLRGSKFAVAPWRIGRNLEYFIEQNKAKREELQPRLQALIDDTFKNMYLPLEKDVMVAQLKLYIEKSGYELPAAVKQLKEDAGDDLENYVNAIMELSIFTSKERLEAFLMYPNKVLLENDLLYLLSKDLLAKYRENPEAIATAEEAYSKAYRKFVQGLRVSKLSSVKYPDANSTLRLTYGKVVALPKDARNDAKINNYTTMKGMIAKYKPNDDEFDLPAEVMDLYKKKDFGQYADKNGYMPVNFLTNNDITGGNSGSPVLNGKGELIGLAFDGNIEAMAGDVIFDDKLQRTINVDIRYVLWLVDKLSGADNIIKELTIKK